MDCVAPPPRNPSVTSSRFSVKANKLISTGQEMKPGTRIPPSNTEALHCRNPLVAASCPPDLAEPSGSSEYASGSVCGPAKQ